MKSKIFNNIGLRLIVPPIVGFVVSVLFDYLVLTAWGYIDPDGGFAATVVMYLLTAVVLPICIGISYLAANLLSMFIQGNKLLAIPSLIIMVWYQFTGIYLLATSHLDAGIEVGLLYYVRMIAMIIFMLCFFVTMDVYIFINDEYKQKDEKLSQLD